MVKRKRATGDSPHYIIRPNTQVVREFLKMQKRLEAQPSSSVVAPRLFALEELLGLILSYLSPQDLLRSQGVNQAFHRAVNSRGSLQKLFFIPNQDETQVAWNAFRGAAIPEWFPTTRALVTPRIGGRNANNHILWQWRWQGSRKKFKSWKRSIVASDVNLSTRVEIDTRAPQRYDGQTTGESETSHHGWCPWWD